MSFFFKVPSNPFGSFGSDAVDHLQATALSELAQVIQ
jgi:hypothetical protein